MTIDDWREMTLSAISTSDQMTGLTIAACDAGGHLLYFYRGQGALIAPIDSAQAKARTAVFFGTETRNLPGATPLTPALLAASSGQLAFIAGGIPLRDVSGQIIGGVGVGGGTLEQDQAAARAAADVWSERNRRAFAHQSTAE